MSSASVLIISFGPPLVPPRPMVPNVPDVPVCDDAGPRMLDGSRPSAFDSTSESVPCQLFDIRLVPMIVTPLYRLYSPGTFVIWNTLWLNGDSSLKTETVRPLASTPALSTYGTCAYCPPMSCHPG